MAMKLRRVLRFNGSVGFTLPVELARILELHWKDYVEVYLKDDETLIVRKHKAEEFKIQNV